MATPPTPIAGALTINATTGVILSPVTAALFKSANGIGSGSGDVTASGTLTANRLILGGGTTVVSASDLSYSSPTLTVPASFGITGAGSLAFTAGGSNQNITLTPSGTGTVAGVYNTGTLVSPAFNGFHVVGANNGENGFLADSFNGTNRFVGRAAGGTMASPSALGLDATIMSVTGRGFDGSAYSGSAVGMTFRASEAWTGSARGTRFEFFSIPKGTTTARAGMFYGSTTNLLSLGVSGVTVDYPAWGTTGVQFNALAGTTYRDNSSSGTVATAVANSFQTTTFAASSATTFTNAANLYIAGDVAAGTNVTLTNSYGLWNVGKTRLDGALLVNSTGTFNFNTSALPSPTFSGVQVGGADSTGVAYTATTFANDPQFIGRRYGGTNASRTATATQNVLLRLRAEAYDGTNATGNIGGFRVVTNQAITSSNQGTYLAFNATPDNSASTGDVLYLGNTDGLGTQISGVSATRIIGGAGNMTITAGTGNSRTMTLRTTTSGGTATNWLVGDATQNTTAGGSITTSTPNGGTAGAWKFGIRVAAVSALDTTQYIQLDVGGTLYKLALVT